MSEKIGFSSSSSLDGKWCKKFAFCRWSFFSICCCRRRRCRRRLFEKKKHFLFNLKKQKKLSTSEQKEKKVKKFLFFSHFNLLKFLRPCSISARMHDALFVSAISLAPALVYVKVYLRWAIPWKVATFLGRAIRVKIRSVWLKISMWIVRIKCVRLTLWH